MKAIAKKKNSWYTITASHDMPVIEIIGDIGWYDVPVEKFLEDLAAIDAPEVKILFHTGGGSVFDGTAMYNAVKLHPAKFTGEVLALCASMGAYLLQACDRRVAPENAYIMIHKPRGGAYGTIDDVDSYAKLLTQATEDYYSNMAAATGKDVSEIEEDTKADLWLDGNEALEYGLIDEVTESHDMKALQSVQLAAIANVPPTILEKLKVTTMSGKTAEETGKGGGAQGSQAAVQSPAAQTTTVQTTASPAAAPQVSEAELKAQFKREERQRKDDIRAVFKGFDGHNDLLNACLDDDYVDAAQAKDKLLAALGSTAKPATGVLTAQHVSVPGSADLKEAMTNALAVRAGVVTLDQNGRDFKGMSMAEMARAALHERGVSTYGMDRMEMIGAAFTHTSSDFTHVLSDVARVALLKGYDESEETFQKWTKKGTLSDFKVSKRVGLESFPTLDEIPDGGEYQAATLNDTGEQIQLATYGKEFTITRQTIINDDLGAFTDVPAKMGRAALRTVGNLVYAILTSNPKMLDNKPLFHADHKNLMAAAMLSVAALDKAEQMMAKQEDDEGTPLNIEPAFLIVGRGSKGTANMYMKSQNDPDGKHASVPNIMQGMAEVISDARIDKAITGNNPLPWFLAAGSQFDTVEVAYLDGNEKPYLEQKNGWTVDGVAHKVRIDAGVSALSYRTLLKNPGANPS